MSAWIVDREHINVIVWAGPHFSRYPMRWPVVTDGVTTYPTLGDDVTMSELGHLLWHENHVSVNYRYSENEATPAYQYREPRSTAWSPVEVLKAIACLDYQSCEHPGWATSQARAYLTVLEQTLINVLPGYDAAPWGIDTTKVPAALAAV
jgi:hypothetical protein